MNILLEQLAKYGKTMKTELETLTLAFSQFVSKPFIISPPEIVLDNFEKLKKDDTEWFSPCHAIIGPG